MLIPWFHFHSFVSSVKPLYGAQPKTVATTFSCLHIIIAGDQLLSLPYLPNPSAQAGYDTRSIFKRSLTGLNSEFSFS